MMRGLQMVDRRDITPEIIVELAPHLDEQTLSRLLRNGMQAPNNDLTSKSIQNMDPFL